MLPNKVQPKEYSMGSDTEDRLYNLAAAVQRNGNLNRAYVNGNENGVKLNWNWTDNQWNRNCRFVAVCNSSHAPSVYSEGVSFRSCLRQPPSILPISVSGSDIRIYFLLSSALISQAMFKKNFTASSLVVAR